MVTYCVKKMMTTCSPMIGQFFDTMIVASNDKQWLITTYPNISVGNCFEPPSWLACIYRVMDARGKFGEHEVLNVRRCVSVAVVLKFRTLKNF